MPELFNQIVKGLHPIDPRLEVIGKEYPKLHPFLRNVVVEQGKPNGPNDPRQLEFYPPWESENPHHGKITIELLRKMAGGEETNAITGDLLHYIGAINPVTKSPIDPNYWALKQAVARAITPSQHQVDARVYGQAGQAEGRSFEDWMNQSRLDAYIRGWVTPDKTDEWRRQGYYSDPAMRNAVMAIQNYLRQR